MKLISTEIDAESVQLTYTDGPAATEAKELLIVRMPLAGDEDLLLRLQLNTLRRVRDGMKGEMVRLDQELRTK